MYPPLTTSYFFTLISDSLQTILCDDGSENQGDLLYLLLQVQYCTVREGHSEKCICLGEFENQIPFYLSRFSFFPLIPDIVWISLRNMHQTKFPLLLFFSLQGGHTFTIF
jgi:hypothetical protein